MKYRVILQWEQADEGNYCDVFEAPDEEAAKRMCAEAMADSESGPHPDDYTPEEREQWIRDTVARCDDISIDPDLARHVRALIDAASKLLANPGQTQADDMNAAIVAATLALQEAGEQ
jgi:hypothetical protein